MGSPLVVQRLGAALSPDGPQDGPAAPRLVTEEGFAGSGSISRKAYGRWVRAGSPARLALFLVLMAVWQAAYQVQNLYVNHWASAADKAAAKYPLIFLAIMLVCMASNFGQVRLLMSFCVNASSRLYDQMVGALLRTRYSFFEQTPQGRLLNRMTKDLDSTDIVIGRNLSTAANNLGFLVASIVVMAVSSWPTILVVLVLGAAYAYVFGVFRRVAPMLKRLDNVTKSPVYSAIGESLQGLTSIRAYARGEDFRAKFRREAEANSAAYYYSLCLNKWLAFRLNLLSAAFAFLVSLIVILVAPLDGGSGLASLTVGYAYSMIFILAQLVTSWVLMESEFSSVERLEEYCDLPPEGVFTKPCARIEELGSRGLRWPRPGESGIRVEGLNFRYRPELDLTLRGVGFEIEPRSHVGVVGRTGAGKSSITVAMFRLAEPDAGSRITIDGVDILSEVGLYQARRALAIIPQDPFLFSGTLRCNLCPYSQAEAEGVQPPAGLERVPDEQMWRVLEQVRLKEYFQRQPGGLDARIAAGGDNLSAGQKQLVCVARALLRDASCIVLDEATASIDRESDRLVQETIRSALAGTTVFSIAHRLDTIIDFDRVLVMDAGRVAEYDTPANLLRDPGSVFSGLVDNTGEEMAARLRAAAALAEEQRARGEEVRVALG